MNVLTRNDLEESRRWFMTACSYSRRWSKLVAVGEALYGNHGPVISGICRDHFPDRLKTELRSLVREITKASDKAWAARPKRIRHNTMMALSRAVATKYGSGFYGPQGCRCPCHRETGKPCGRCTVNC